MNKRECHYQPLPPRPDIAERTEKSTGGRRVSPRKRGSVVGSCHDPVNRREIQVESGLELKHILVLLAAPDIVELREQVGVSVRIGDRATTHWLDLVAYLDDDTRVAIGIKPADLVERSRLVEILEAIARQHGDKVAERFAVLTDRHLSRTCVANASLVLSCLHDRDDVAQQGVREYLAAAPETVTAREIADDTGWGTRAIRATFALVKYGAVAIPEGALLDDETPLRNLIGAAGACENR
jgi:hypothetical protein